jgi:replicative DNA helicase
MAYQKKYPKEIVRRVESIESILDDPTELESVQERTDIVLAADYAEEAREYAKTFGQFRGLSLGFDGLDKRTGSFLPGEVFVLAGGTGFGKSVLAQNIAVNVALQGKMTLFITLEMTKEQTLSRMFKMCRETEQEERVSSLVAFQRASSVNDKDIKILMQKASVDGMDLVILDHLHFLPRGTDNIRNEISRITKLFKEASVEYKIPVIILCHVNRAIEKGQKPDLMHLKESSSIEQDADMVGFVYRDNAKAKDIMEFYMRKNRSRELIYEPMEYLQSGWKLSEIKELEIRSYHD